jgi:hypothetical protein
MIKHLSSEQKHIFGARAGGSITAGDVVAYNLADTDDADKYNQVVKADSDSWTTSLVAGVALDTVSAGEIVQVQFWGVCDSVNVDGSTVAGSPLYVGATAGRAAIASTVALPDGNSDGYVDVTSITIPSAVSFGVALDADTSNLAPAFLTISRPR